jgi:hypothetical protein
LYACSIDCGAVVPIPTVPLKVELAAVIVPVKVGEAENTAFPVPVLVVKAESKFAEDGVPRNVATPAPKPLIPVLTGRPVAFVKVAADGVPRFGVVNAGDVASATTVPVPVVVSHVIADDPPPPLARMFPELPAAPGRLKLYAAVADRFCTVTDAPLPPPFAKASVPLCDAFAPSVKAPGVAYVKLASPARSPPLLY